MQSKQQDKNTLLQELGSCYRGDWSDFDGRTLQDQLDDWISLEENQESINQFREQNSMCPRGDGHWKDYCEDYRCGEQL